MPKIVDAAARRESIADAVLAVIARGGLRAATLASIASESRLAVGSVRHYFTGHAELLEFAAETVVDRTSLRLEKHLAHLGATESPAEKLRVTVDMLSETLPLDDARSVEAAVWLEFAVASRTRPELASTIGVLHDGLRALIGRIISAGTESGRLRREIDADIEVARLHALVDGLLLHGLLPTGPEFGAVSRRVLETHLESLIEQ